MVEVTLVEYFRKWRARGYTEEQLKTYLLSRGYALADVDEAAAASRVLSRALPTNTASPATTVVQRQTASASTHTHKRVLWFVIALVVVTSVVSALLLPFGAESGSVLASLFGAGKQAAIASQPVTANSTTNASQIQANTASNASMANDTLVDHMTPRSSTKNMTNTSKADAVVIVPSHSSGGGGSSSSSTSETAATTTSCSDGLQNGDELGVDCGGSCAACSEATVAAALFSFEESSGMTVWDANSTINGSLVGEVSRVDGVNGTGLEFAGAGYVSLGKQFGTITDGLTVAAWIKPAATSGYQGIVMHGGPNIDSFALYVLPNTETVAFKTSGASAEWLSVENVSALFDSQWHFIAATYDGVRKILYLDERVLANVSCTGAIDTASDYNLLIGAGRDETPPGLLYDGVIDEVRLYDHAISAAGIAAMSGEMIVPTCSDGLQNGDESGIDCGGSCAACTPQPTCTDGLLNGDELGVDCGGSCTACPSCSDGLLNQDESGIDCGGTCDPCPIVPTCSDGLQNGDELGVDCGGSCTACLASFTRTFYVAASGNDENDGLSMSAPWKTISRVNDEVLQPGDAVLFRRGDTFFGSLVMAESGMRDAPITFGAYGTGEKPIITGFTTVTGWNNLGGNLWESTNQVSELSTANMVTINGVNTAMGRYPNADAANGGYLTYESHTTDSLTSASLSATPDWTGAELVFKSTTYSMEKANITAQSGGTITYASAKGATGHDGYGFFVQNDERTLDQQGEWYYDPSSHKIIVYSASTPSAVQVASINYLVQFTGGWDFDLSQANVARGNWVTIQDLAFTGANGDAFYIWDFWWTKLHDVVVRDCDISFTGVNGINLQAYNMTIENNVVSDTQSGGIDITYSKDVVVRNNAVRNVGLLAGMSPAWGAWAGIQAGSQERSVVSYNTVMQARYDGISFGGTDVVLSHNYIDGFCLLLADGGGIYGGANAVIDHNIVVNGLGNRQGTPSQTNGQANGIYLDDNAHNVSVHDNIVMRVSNGGIFLHNARNMTVADNLLFDNLIQILTQDDNNAGPVEEDDFFGNKMIAKTDNQLAAAFTSGAGAVPGIGLFDANYYTRPVDDVLTIKTSDPFDGSTARTFENWQAYMGQDAHGQRSPIDLQYYQLSGLTGATKVTNGEFSTNINGAGCWSDGGTCTVSWASDKLDGGALQVQFDKWSTLSIPISGVSASHDYILRFSLQGAAESNRTIGVYLRKQGSPYTRLTPTKYVRVAAARTEVELAFASPIEESTAGIYIDLLTPTGEAKTMWLDNVALYEADLSLIDPDTQFFSTYNPASAMVTTSLPAGTFIDSTGRQFSGSLQVPAYGGAVLMKQG